MANPTISARPQKTINSFISKWNAGGGNLPIQYTIDNTKFPVNSEDASESFSSVNNNNGLAEIVTDSATSLVAGDYVTINTSTYGTYPNTPLKVISVSGTDQVTLDTPFIDTESGTVLLYYNNYRIKIEVYAGINSDHPHAYEDAIELIGSFQIRPNSNNQVKADIHKYVKRKLNSINDIDQNAWPNDLYQWTDFYITYQEIYDDAGTETQGTKIDDSSEFIGHAVNGALQLANAYGGNYYAYIADLNASGEATWLTFFEQSSYGNRRYFDLSMLSDDGEFEVDIIQYDESGNSLQTDTIIYTGDGRGVYRIALQQVLIDLSTEYLTLQAFDSYTGDALTVTHRVNIDNTCIEPLDPPLPVDPISATDGLGSILVEWTVNQPDADRQLLFRSTSPTSGFVEIANLGVTVAEYDDSDVSAGTTYYYFVQTWKNGLFVNSAIVSAELLNFFGLTIDPDGTGTSGSTEFTLPLTDDAATSNVDVYNADTGALIASGVTTASPTVDFGSSANVNIAIVGTLGGWKFNNAGDRLKVLEWSRNGIFSGLGSTGNPYQRAWYGCANMDYTATDELVLAGNCERFLSECTALVGNSSMNNWNMTNVNSLSAFFSSCISFNQPLNNWDVSNVTNMFAVFASSVATSFNQPLNNWDVSNVTTFLSMFASATSFNQPLNNWDVSSATTFRSMFQSASSFDQDLSDWGVHLQSGRSGGVPNMTIFLNGSGMSVTNYDALLIAWDAVDLIDNVTIGVNGLTYTLGGAAEAARDNIIANDLWTFSGDSGV